MVDTVIQDITVKQEPTTLNDMINTHDSVGGVVYWSHMVKELSQEQFWEAYQDKAETAHDIDEVDDDLTP